MTSSTVVIGESLVDVVSAADGRSPAEHPGGSPMNIAIGLSRLGRPVTLVTAIGTDARGGTIRDHLDDSTVALAPGSIRDEPTSTATAHLSSTGSAEYVFDLRWSLPVSFTAADPVLTGAAIVHVGSIAAFVEPGGAAVAALLRELIHSERAPLVSFDPNIRPSITPGREPVRERFEEIARSAAVVKLSDEDASWLYPGKDLGEIVDRVLRLGAGLVALTRGAEGALLATRHTWRTIPGLEVEVADTIGAGDAFMSGVIDRLACLLDDGAPPAALQDGHIYDSSQLARIGAFAVRCAALTVSRPGANPPTMAELIARTDNAPCGEKR